MHNGAVDIAYSEDECREVQKDCTDFVKGILDNLAARFLQCDLLKEIKVFDPSALLPEKDLLIYGESEIDVLADNYSFVNKSECKIEWDTLKQCMSANFRKFKFKRVSSKASQS